MSDKTKKASPKTKKKGGEESTAETASFEEIVGELRLVVDRLEEGELPLEESLQMFEQGIRLSRLGQRRLDEAERRVELLLSGEGEEARTESLDI